MKHGIFMVLFIISSIALGAQSEIGVECDEGVVSEPVELVYGAHTTACEIVLATDLDRFEFVGTIGEQVRINVLVTSGYLSPVLEVRDPTGTFIDSASCTSTRCSLSLDLTLPLPGTYTLYLSDLGTNDSGGYTLQLERLVPVSDLSEALDYDEPVEDAISPQTDIDAFTFDGTAGTEVRFNVLASSGYLTPTVEIRDPNGTLVVNGVDDGAGCITTGCSFSLDFSPALSGTYSLIIYDSDTNYTGDYQLSLFCLVGDCDDNGAPDTDSATLISYVTPVSDVISPAVDGDFFKFTATAGTEVRFNVLASSGYLTPTVEIRDPNGTLVVNGGDDGAGCITTGCSFSLDFSPALSGTYSLIIYDSDTNYTGDYQLSLFCLVGDCDSDADGVPDGDPPVLQYGGANIAVYDIDPAVDGDFYIFGGTAGTEVRFNVLASSGYLTPTVEIRDPDGTLVVNGVDDGAGCITTGCSFSLDFIPALAGNYSLVIYDLDTNYPGGYQLSLQCLVGDCADAVRTDGDNCIDAPNGPLILDAGYNNQLDTDDDGYGNICDADLDNGGGIVNFSDLAMFKTAFGTTDPDADFDGSGTVNFGDLTIFKALFGQLPGPSGIKPLP